MRAVEAATVSIRYSRVRARTVLQFAAKIWQLQRRWIETDPRKWTDSDAQAWIEICKKRRVSRAKELVQLATRDAALRKPLLWQIQQLFVERKRLTEKIKTGKALACSEQKRATEIKSELAQLRAQERSIECRLDAIKQRLPNDIHPDVPFGSEENARVVECADAAQLVSSEYDHIEIGRRLQLFNFEAAALTSGASFYFLKNDAVLLEQALIAFALAKARAQGFALLACPSIVRTQLAAKCGFQPRDDGGENQIFEIVQYGSAKKNQTHHDDQPREQQQQDKQQSLQQAEGHVQQLEMDVLNLNPRIEGTCLAGTAEIPLAAYYAGRSLDELPLRACGVGRAFRRESGARGRVNRGIYRVHEFSKVELFAWTRPEQSEQMLASIVQLQREIIQELEIPYRVLELPTYELNASAYHKFDIEGWMPGRGKFGELTSASNCTDYQSSRLNISFNNRANGNRCNVHTLNGTAAAIPRLIIAVLENNYNPRRNRVRIPTALRPYLMNKQFIELVPDGPTKLVEPIESVKPGHQITK